MNHNTLLEELAIRVEQPNTKVVEAKIASLNILIYCDSDKLNLSPKKGAITVTLYNNNWYKVIREKRDGDKHKQCYLGRYIQDTHKYVLVDYEGRSLPRWEARYKENRARSLAQRAEEQAQLAIQTANQSDDNKPI